MNGIARLLVVGTVAWLAHSGYGITPVLVKDIVTGTSGSDPQSLTCIGDTAYFSAQTPDTGRELWRTDGTAAGTQQVKDILDGGGSSNPSQFTKAGGYVFFTANDAIHGNELWRTDGTEGGTKLVCDINPGRNASDPSQLVAIGNVLYFAANDGTHGKELWKTDGTASGTVPVLRIQGLAGGYVPARLTCFKGRLYFSAWDQTHGRELWQSDGTAAGTHIVLDINSQGNSDPWAITEVNGTLFFGAKGSGGDWQLWKSDGTASGTTLVRDGFKDLDQFASASGKLVFCADDSYTGYEPWVSDGTSSGTFQLKDIYSGQTSSHPRSLSALNGAVFFVAYDAKHKWQLWKTDGTKAGTALLTLIPDGHVSEYDKTIINCDGILFFAVDSDEEIKGLWRTDGTPEGTYRAIDVWPGNTWKYGSYPIALNGMMLFNAVDSLRGQELWKADPHANRPIRLFYDANRTFYEYRLLHTFDANLVWGTTPSFRELGLSDGRRVYSVTNCMVDSFLPQANGYEFFLASDEIHGLELWRTDGTTDGTMLLKDINPGSLGMQIQKAIAFNGALYFLAKWGSTLCWWKSDGTTAGTIAVDLVSTSAEPICTVGGRLLFSRQVPNVGTELLSSDGTKAGTAVLRTFDKGFTRTIVVGQWLYFLAYDPWPHRKLWRTDGTAAGTQPLLESDFSFTGMINADGRLFFSTYSDDADPHTYPLYVSDGTPSGTTKVATFYAAPKLLAAERGICYFTVSDAAIGEELWKSDGTPGGTGLVLDINPGTASSQPEIILHTNGWVYFTASQAASGRELWKTDGTAAGTKLIKDIVPGTGSPSVGRAAFVKGRAFILIDDDVHGTEVWTTDGSEQGTFLVREMSCHADRGPMSLYPLGNNLYILGQLAGTWDNLYVYSLTEPPLVTAQPQDCSVIAGRAAVFSASVTGDPLPAVRWQRSINGGTSWETLLNNGTFTGTDTTNLHLLSVSADMTGWLFRLYATNSMGFCQSRAALLDVLVPPQIVTSPTNVSTLAGQSVAFHVTAKGTPSPALRWQQSCDAGVTWMDLFDGNGIAGSSSEGLTLNNVTATMNGFLFRVAATNKAGSTTSAPALLTVRSESVKPTLTLVSKVPTAKVYSATLALTGTASDNAGAARVVYQQNGGQWLAAEGTTSWTINLALIPGTNVILLKAIDSSNNESDAKKVTVTYAQRIPISLQTLFQGASGGGKVSGIANGQPLEVGVFYKLTATPYASNWFAGWHLSISLPGGMMTYLVSTNATLNFQMQSNATALTAEFVPNPFVAAKGNYTGLFIAQDLVTASNSGSITLTLTDKGRFSGKLTFVSGSASFTGQFTARGEAGLVITGPQKQQINAGFYLRTGLYSAVIVGTLSCSGWVADAYAGIGGKCPAAAATGRYTLVTHDAQSTASGMGAFTLSVAKGGTVSLAGNLGNGTAISKSAALVNYDDNAPGAMPLFAAGSTKEFVIGWVVFDDILNSAGVRWIKPPSSKDPFHPNGLDVELSLEGNAYKAAAAKANALNWTNGIVTLSGGNLDEVLSTRVSIVKSTVTVPNNERSLKLTLKSSTGAYSGSFVHPKTKKVTKFSGVILQGADADCGAGWFLGTNQTGRILLEPSQP